MEWTDGAALPSLRVVLGSLPGVPSAAAVRLHLQVPFFSTNAPPAAPARSTLGKCGSRPQNQTSTQKTREVLPSQSHSHVPFLCLHCKTAVSSPPCCCSWSPGRNCVPIADLVQLLQGEFPGVLAGLVTESEKQSAGERGERGQGECAGRAAKCEYRLSPYFLPLVVCGRQRSSSLFCPSRLGRNSLCQCLTP